MWRPAYPCTSDASARGRSPLLRSPGKAQGSTYSALSIALSAAEVAATTAATTVMVAGMTAAASAPSSANKKVEQAVSQCVQAGCRACLTCALRGPEADESHFFSRRCICKCKQACTPPAHANYMLALMSVTTDLIQEKPPLVAAVIITCNFPILK